MNDAHTGETRYLPLTPRIVGRANVREPLTNRINVPLISGDERAEMALTVMQALDLATGLLQAVQDFAQRSDVHNALMRTVPLGLDIEGVAVSVEMRDDAIVPWCYGGPPVTLLDAVRSVMQPEGGMQHPRSMTAPEVHDEIRDRWPEAWPLVSTLDVANELRRFYG